MNYHSPLTTHHSPLIQKETEISFGVPQASGIYQNQRLKLTISEVCFNGKSWHFPNADLPGCLLLNPSASHDATRFASTTYLSQIARQSLLMKLFLLDEPSDFFQLVYPAVKGKNAPIKIWRIHYSTGIEPVSDYLRSDAPKPAILSP